MEIREYSTLPDEAAHIRRTVFIEEQGFEEEFDAIDDRAIHLVAFEGDEPIGCCRIFEDDRPGCFHMGRLAVLPDFRGFGVGAEILAAAERAAARRSGREMQLSAQVRVSGFYARNGYESCGEKYMDEHVPHVMMHKRLQTDPTHA